MIENVWFIGTPCHCSDTFIIIFSELSLTLNDSTELFIISSACGTLQFPTNVLRQGRGHINKDVSEKE